MNRTGEAGELSLCISTFQYALKADGDVPVVTIAS